MRFTLKMLWAALLLVVGTLALPAGPIRPLDLSTVANRAFRDATAGDQQGGWIDLGANDLRILEAGPKVIGNVPFVILPDNGGTAKAGIVLGQQKLPFLDAEARLAFATPEKGPYLYLLHACAMNDKNGEIAGRLTAEFADGSKQEWRLRIGRDVQPWTSAQNAANAQRSWTEYNSNTQISLFVSKFPLESKALVALHMQSEEAVWMVVAASVGDDVKIVPLRPEFVMKSDFTAPDAFTPEALAGVPSDGVPKNIIMIIGDGMGQGALNLASLHTHGELGKLAMQSLPVAGLCTTYSGNADVTDSAASATALSSGYKTFNGAIGMTMNKEGRRTIAEQAKEAGWAVGLLTTDSLTGATPSAYVAHVPSRAMSVEIADWYALSRFDLFVGASNAKPFLPESAGGMRKDGRNLVQELTGAGYAQIASAAELASAKNAPVFGFAPFASEMALGEMTAAALPYLAARSNKGFFIMIECSWPDGGGHGNNPDLSAKGALSTDYTVRAAVDYALQNKETLVLVTADHETGLLTATANRQNPKRPHVMYQSTGHSQTAVPVFAFGPGSEHFHGVMDNTDVPKVFARFWNLTLHQPVGE